METVVNPENAARILVEHVMERNKWRAPQVASALGCSDDVVRRWLRGERRMQMDEMIKLARIGQVDLNELFGLNFTAGQSTLTREEILEFIRSEIQRVVANLAVKVFGELARPDLFTAPTPGNTSPGEPPRRGRGRPSKNP